MDTILQHLAHDHRACDAVLASLQAAIGARDWVGAEDLYTHFRAVLDRHLRIEETVLFPAFESHTQNSARPTQAMRTEHRQIATLLDDLALALGEWNPSGCGIVADTLRSRLRQHVEYEEALLYPMTDEALGSAREGLLRAMLAC